ncbi:hypothetical protein Z946_3409 [Sulfitobacter noctilucicola]|nr:hypothetical protein Z946_3409 [Sulfitobacter noctilucicola]
MSAFLFKSVRMFLAAVAHIGQSLFAAGRFRRGLLGTAVETGYKAPKSRPGGTGNDTGTIRFSAQAARVPLPFGGTYPFGVRPDNTRY